MSPAIASTGGSPLRRHGHRVIAHDNPGLERVWIDTVSGHLGPWETKRAVLRLYRSTRIDEQEAIATRLRSQNHDALVVFGDADAYIPVE
jgi:hypothetical protein